MLREIDTLVFGSVKLFNTVFKQTFACEIDKVPAHWISKTKPNIKLYGNAAVLTEGLLVDFNDPDESAQPVTPSDIRL